MKIIITGSLGHIGKSLTDLLLKTNHDITVVSSSVDRKQLITELGATAAIGSVQDAEFLKSVFKGADAVYTMVPPVSYMNPNLDPIKHFTDAGNTYKTAILNTGIKQVVNLSSWGAHRVNGTGGIVGTYYLERVLNELPADVNITHIRPASFYYNLLSFIPQIKNTGRIAANYGAGDKTVLVAPSDIARVIAAELENPQQGRHVRYVGSDELTCNEIAAILGHEIGIPDLKWEIISPEEARKALEKAGLPSKSADLLIELQTGHHKGIIAEDYWLHRPSKLGVVKTTDFAKEFSAAYHQK